MARTGTILLGKITKINGFDGAVTVRTERKLTVKIPETGPVFLEIEGRPVPFFPEYIEEFSDGSVKMRFEDYSSHEKMKEFAGCNVLIPSGGKETKDSFSFRDLDGFSLFNSGKLLLGEIIEVVENPGQVLLSVKNNKGSEFLVPLHEDLIISFDRKGRKIIMDLPEGLLDINS